jgi:FKBP-type peptidyl-prolyl cis-trans isomerase SlyD
MNVAEKTVVQFEYTLCIRGEIIEQTHPGQRQTILIGHAYDLPPRLEQSLVGHGPGAYQVLVAPAQAYGEIDPAKRQTVPRSNFPDDALLELGERFFAFDDDGQPLSYAITAIYGDRVDVDGNHPLAGETLEYSITIHSVRVAEAEELSHGHVHGEGGVKHQH